MDKSKRPFRIRKSKQSFRRRLPPIQPGDRIDYRNISLLSRFISDQGKILSSRYIYRKNTMLRKFLDRRISFGVCMLWCITNSFFFLFQRIQMTKVNCFCVFQDPDDEASKKVENEELLNNEVGAEVEKTKTEENDLQKDAPEEQVEDGIFDTSPDLRALQEKDEILDKMFEIIIRGLDEQESKNREQEIQNEEGLNNEVGAEVEKTKPESIDDLLEELWEEEQAAYYASYYTYSSEDEDADDSEVWLGTHDLGDGEQEIYGQIYGLGDAEDEIDYYLPDFYLEDLYKYLTDLDLDDFENFDDTNNA